MGEIPERIVPGTLAWDLYHLEHIQRYQFALPYCKGKNILDVACGVGYGSFYLAQRGAGSVTGVDISEKAIKWATDHYRLPNLRFFCQDARATRFPDDEFDVIVSFETIEHLPDPERFLDEIHRLLKPTGVFVCSSPNRDFKHKSRENPYHLSEMSYQVFRQIVEKKFKILHQYHQSHTSQYIRMQEIIREINEINRAVRFSKLLKMENLFRKFLGKPDISIESPDPRLSGFIEGDMVIEELITPEKRHLTFIFVAEPKRISQ